MALDGGDLRVFLGDDGGDDLTEEQTGFVGHVRRQRDVDVQTVRPGGFRKSDGADVVELIVDPPSDVEHTVERHALRGIEIERHVVGGLERGDSREPRIL